MTGDKIQERSNTYTKTQIQGVTSLSSKLQTHTDLFYIYG